MTMRTPLSWQNTFQNPRRCLAATAGVAFAVLLMFMEIGFLDAAKVNAAMLYRDLEFDAVIVSRGYVSMQRTLPVNAFRVLQARSVPGVASAIALWVDGAHWLNPLTHDQRSCRIIGVNPDDNPFLSPGISSQLPRVRTPNTILVDRLSSARYGPWEVGGTAIIDNTAVQIAGDYTQGTGLITDGGVIASPETFQHVTGRGAGEGFDVGLVRARKGEDVDVLIDALRANLPDDVMVLSKADIIAREQFFWVNLKPVGIMFRVGAIVAFLIGAVVLYQVLALEINNRMHEFATMKALGYAPRDLYRVGGEQALILAVLGYLPAFLLAFVLYRVVFSASRLPLFMAPGRALLVWILTLVMCAVAAMLALQRLRHADPAELFR